MKTQNEQIEFANKLQELTSQHGKLISMLEDATDKVAILKQIQETQKQMNILRDSYMSDSL